MHVTIWRPGAPSPCMIRVSCQAGGPSGGVPKPSARKETPKPWSKLQNPCGQSAVGRGQYNQEYNCGIDMSIDLLEVDIHLPPLFVLVPTKQLHGLWAPFKADDALFNYKVCLAELKATSC